MCANIFVNKKHALIKILIVFGLISGIHCLISGEDISFEEEETCSRKTTCIRVDKCLPALKMVRRSGRHDFKRCGFENKLELLCCPEELEETTTLKQDPSSGAVVRGPVIRKSVEACEQYINEISFQIDFHIYGGTDAGPKEFPHMAAIGYNNPDSSEDTTIKWLCGGSLISKRHVLTAAHCSTSRTGDPVLVRLGIIDLEGNISDQSLKDYGVEKLTFHPEYSRKLKINDIAIITLNETVATNDYVFPACLYSRPDDPSEILVTGWGLKEDGLPSNRLQKVKLITVNLEKCNVTHTSAQNGKSIIESQICALSDSGRKDACTGDSGGPMQVSTPNASSIYSIVGVVSFGRGCGGTFPGVYTRVYSYLSWIERIVWP